MARTTTLFGIILFSALLLSGCAGFGRGGGNDDTVSINTDFHSGTEGIRLRFIDRAPPNVVFDTNSVEDEIQVLVEVWNRGAFSGYNGQGVPVALYLGGFDQNFVELPTRHSILELDGKSIYNAEGEQALAEFPGDGSNFGFDYDGGINLPDQTDSYSPDLQITACYPYETEATLMTCVSRDPYSITTEQICNPGMISRGQGSQGAPVSLTVDAENVPGQMLFKIRVNNAGPGRVIHEDTVPAHGSGGSIVLHQACPYDLSYEHMNKIEYTVEFMGCIVESGGTTTCGNQIAECQPHETILLTNGAGIMYCNFPITGTQEGAFQTPLLVKLRYGYMDSVRKHVEIKNIKT
ncbi:MAG: hypothetical protein ACTSWQ_05695 [Candidatus Thorarchaeota archaeon]